MDQKFSKIKTCELLSADILLLIIRYKNAHCTITKT